MKAAQISGFGDTSVVKVAEIDKPAIKDGQVLVEVHAASLNPFDTKIREGYMPLTMPVTLGGDVAGVIAKAGAGVEGFAVGDAVYGEANVAGGSSGAFAEYAATAAKQVAKAPSNLSMQETASLPLVGASALQALTKHINLQPSQKIFINGGAGGIGQVAIQIAKHIGAYVAVTATGDQIDAVKKLGADEVIDYKTQDFAELLHDYDAVFDTVGGDLFNKTLDVLKRGGIAVSMAGQADEAKTQELGVTAISQVTNPRTQALDQLRELIESGVVKPNIGKVFNLDEIQAAFTARESGKINGKIVLEIKK